MKGQIVGWRYLDVSSAKLNFQFRIDDFLDKSNSDSFETKNWFYQLSLYHTSASFVLQNS